MSRRIWTTEEEERLKKLSDKFHYEIIAKKMDRTPTSIYLRAKKLDIVLIQDKRDWTTEEKNLLKRLWGTCKIEIIAKKLRRTIKSCEVEARRLHLGAKISNNTDIILISDLSDILSISRQILLGSWVKKGLEINSFSVSENRSYMGVKLEDLMKFLEENQELWDSKNLEKNILGVEPLWLKQKRKEDLDKEYKKYTFWTDEEKSLARLYFEKGKSYEFISQRVHHPIRGVEAFLNEEGYSRVPRTNAISYIRQNKDKMTVEEMAEYLNKTSKQIRKIIRDLSYNVQVYEEHDWSLEEDNYLKENYKRILNYELANHIGVCKEILFERLKFLGIYGMSYVYWTTSQDEFLKNNYDKLSLQELADQCGFSFYLTKKRLIELGIYKQKSEIEESRRQLLSVLKKLLNMKKEQEEIILKLK